MKISAKLIALFLLSSSLSVGQIISTSYSISKNNGDDSHTYKIKNGSSSFEVNFKGEITFSDDDRKVKAISPGGFLEIKKKTFGNARSVVIESDGRGELSYEYYIGRKKEEYIPDGEKWLADVLIEVIYATGLGAETRTQRIYKKKGISGVVSEIGNITSDFVKGKYFIALLKIEQLPTGQLAEVADEISRQIDSDYEAAKVYREGYRAFLQKDAVSEAMFRGISRIDSDYEKGKLLRAIVEYRDLSQDQLKQLMLAAYDIDSDYEKGKLSRAFITELGRTEVFAKWKEKDTFFRTISSIDSDYEKSKVLQEFFSLRELSSEDIKEGFMVAANIDSDFEKGNILEKVVKKDTETVKDYFLEGYFRVVEATDSDFEKGKMVKNLVESFRDYPTNEMTVRLLNMIGTSFSSSHEMGRVLSSITPAINDDPAINQAFFRAVGKVDSSFEQGKILKELTNRNSLYKVTILGVLKIVPSISSSFEQGKVMESIARSIRDLGKNDSEIETAYRSAAKGISSDSAYREAMEAYPF